MLASPAVGLSDFSSVGVITSLLELLIVTAEISFVTASISDSTLAFTSVSIASTAFDTSTASTTIDTSAASWAKRIKKKNYY